MFTGIVECIGSTPLPLSSTPTAIVKLTTPSTAISALDPSPETGTTLTISTPTFLLSDAHLGDSIAINGTCLTITAFTPSTFTVGVSPETLRRTNLGRLSASSPVNLERAVAASGMRMGGHFVQGHVDTVATIADVRDDGEARVIRLKPREKGVLRYVVEKG
ncbi:MAG: hypothetical protein LQ341_005639, partial [Variospora aurantia]